MRVSSMSTTIVQTRDRVGHTLDFASCPYPPVGRAAQGDRGTDGEVADPTATTFAPCRNDPWRVERGHGLGGRWAGEPNGRMAAWKVNWHAPCYRSDEPYGDPDGTALLVSPVWTIACFPADGVRQRRSRQCIWNAWNTKGTAVRAASHWASCSGPLLAQHWVWLSRLAPDVKPGARSRNRPRGFAARPQLLTTARRTH